MYRSHSPILRSSLTPLPRPFGALAPGLVLLFLLVPVSARAEAEAPGDIVTDRPDVAESSETVGAGRFQAELGVDLESSTAEGERALDLRTPLKLRFGLSERWEAHLETEGYAGQFVEGEDGEHGAGDIDLGVKVNLYPGEGWIPSTGLLLALTLPAGSGPGAGRAVDLSPTLAVDWGIGDHWGIGANLGFTFGLWDEAAGAPEQAFRFALAVGRTWAPLSERLRTYLEVFGEHSLGHGDQVLMLDGGFSLLLSPNLQLDLALRGGLTHAAPDFGGGLGMSFRI